ncbi:MAG: alpha/beta hydrolase [Candidatus Hydrogenedentes bacterium]|nr:alpha/beta hydrolase [Candidatus Hydrogenedentota bacterium]
MMHLSFPSDWKEGDKRPAIVFFFGGGWQNGNPSQFAYQAERLAQRGMVAACADYRVKSKDGVGPKSCVEDAKSAVRWLRANGARLGIDAERIVAGGGSAGGHLAACTALTPDLVGENEDGAISSKTSAMVLFNPVLNFSGEPRLLERIDNDEALAKLISPTLHLEAGSPPAILFYGALDRLLPQGEAFVARSKELGIRAELHVTPNQNHGFFNKPPYREDTLHLAEQFLASLGMLNNTPVEVETTQAPA